MRIIQTAKFIPGGKKEIKRGSETQKHIVKFSLSFHEQNGLDTRNKTQIWDKWTCSVLRARSKKIQNDLRREDY